MGKYFGTDGIRGVAGTELTVKLAYDAALATAYVLKKDLGKKPLFIVGRDTRISGDMICAALISGLCAAGADVCDLGVLPTPAIAFFTAGNRDVDAGIVLSASHNPFEHNGIKIFGGDGYKLSDGQEERIEAYIDAPPADAVVDGAAVGVKKEWKGDPAEEYAAFIASKSEDLDGLKIAVDCANGASYKTAKLIFDSLGAECTFINCEPDGVNINDKCGSTHMEGLSELVKRGSFDAGVAFDGDADRCLMTDEKGEYIDGDRMICALAEYLKNTGRLKRGAVVTVMSNLGLHNFLHARGMESRTTAVGDRYVLEEMVKEGFNVGGEQSGHIIMTDYCTTGDGEMTAVQMLSMLKKTGMKASDLSKKIESFAQVMINVEVSNQLKKQVASLPAVKAVEAEIAGLFGKDGRILIRPSGTEPKVRVMVEGSDEEKVRAMAKKAADVIAAAVREV
ncbi:MAG: phosphoglucosamine mutase [Clostridia bacterium]|nr:phosphoglucosamine mutase [Clostridia bacterium]